MEDQLTSKPNEYGKKIHLKKKQVVWSGFSFMGLVMFIFIILMGLLVYYVYQYDNRHNLIIVRRYY
jgi:heme/copper-type cytochrome/quinol oxidase subunit 2